jgi:hypothetical protein
VGTSRLRDFRILTLEPERLKNRSATPNKSHRRWNGLFPETLKRLASSVY